MEILFDVDGVAADFMKYVVQRLYDLTGSVYDTDTFTSYYFTDHFTPADKKVADEFINAPGFAKDIPVVPGAVEVVKKVQDLGHNVCFVTSPNKHSQTWGYDRSNWIREHFDWEDDIIITKVKHKVAGDILVEDKTSNLISWNKTNPKGRSILVDQPYNRIHQSNPLFTNIKDITGMLKII